MGLEPQGLYRPENEHDACGVGFVANIKGRKSHTIVEQGLTVLRNLTHRGAVGWDPKLSDGAGLLIQIPDRFYREEMAKQGVKLPPAGQYGVGMVFLPRDPASRIACEYEIERAIKDEGQHLLGWRDVPVDNSDLAQPAIQLEPVVRQVFIGRGRRVTVTDALERKLYIIRKSSGHAIQALKLKHAKQFYVPSMSARTVCYKGMLLAHQVGEYYLDLKDARVESALALIHQRFSTNTFPSWDLAHPFRMICHMWPLIYPGQSDSASFDNALELLVMGGYSVAHAMMMMIPEAWENHTLMDPQRRAFYEYHAAMMEPWDGPASIAFTDGRQIGATLDRNGLRPSRYIVTDDDLVIMGSECGCLPVPEERIVKKWRLQPGKMFLVDLEKGRIIDDKELKDSLASAKPYAEWIERIRVKLDEVESEKTQPFKSKVAL
ncbi:MAG: glutamate synthase subunit alpha, partial [Betaproteobacteria bacterium]